MIVVDTWRRRGVCDGEHMDLGRSSGSRATNGLSLLPPSPPAAQRWAFTHKAIRTWAGGPPAWERASNIPTQTPLASQRTKRL